MVYIFKQDTSNPVRIILIKGRRVAQERQYEPLQKDARSEVINTFEELYTRLKDTHNEKNLLHEGKTLESDNGTGQTGNGGRADV